MPPKPPTVVPAMCERRLRRVTGAARVKSFSGIVQLTSSPTTGLGGPRAARNASMRGSRAVMGVSRRESGPRIGPGMRLLPDPGEAQEDVVAVTARGDLKPHRQPLRGEARGNGD